ncbi:MBL fold metallo-hydrolase [Halococcoides cellulosivorans]|uniref:Flavoprotein n=1 Tax=Halococcoides cellulosivorans TaxID=1679096 RepID=A0A2R4X0K9_9EURY|nr:MBL fold metallo-hydrolase [Halococcoides cellulosivorans]AWB27301.1 flavoprotein [Halococcoides cellulosivorans]
MITNIAATVQGFSSNAFLVEGERTVLVDAGNDFDAVGEIEAHVETLDAVVLTHTHPDHVGTLGAVRAAFDPEVVAYDSSVDDLDRELADGDRVQIGNHTYQVLHTPGHKPDHVVLYAADPGIAFAGDLVFANGGFGRTDLEGGDRRQLIESIEYVLDTVGDGAFEAMHCGHGPSVTTDPLHDVELALQAAKFR